MWVICGAFLLAVLQGKISCQAQIHPPLGILSRIGISPWEMYITSSNNTCTFEHVKTNQVLLIPDF